MFEKQKIRRKTKKLIDKNLKSTTKIDYKKYIHDEDRKALASLKKIPLLDTLCSKISTILTDSLCNVINMSSKIQVSEKQLPKIYSMVKSICNKLNINMPKIYIELDRSPNAYVIGTEKFNLVITSGLLECLEEDEIYAVLAHECGHIVCEHGLYNMVGRIILNGASMGIDKLSDLLGGKGIIGGIFGGVMAVVDGALELAFYRWYRMSELSADRVAAICCGSATPVIKTMMRLAGGTNTIGEKIDEKLFIAQAEEYKKMTSERITSKAIEFLLTKNDSHPLLVLRASEIQKFADTTEFKELC